MLVNLEHVGAEPLGLFGGQRNHCFVITAERKPAVLYFNVAHLFRRTGERVGFFNHQKARRGRHRMGALRGLRDDAGRTGRQRQAQAHDCKNTLQRGNRNKAHVDSIRVFWG